MVVAPRLDHGMVGKFECRDGYMLKGHNTTQCFFGNWTGMTPWCKEGTQFHVETKRRSFFTPLLTWISTIQCSARSRDLLRMARCCSWELWASTNIGLMSERFETTDKSCINATEDISWLEDPRGPHALMVSGVQLSYRGMDINLPHLNLFRIAALCAFVLFKTYSRIKPLSWIKKTFTILPGTEFFFHI